MKLAHPAERCASEIYQHYHPSFEHDLRTGATPTGSLPSDKSKWIRTPHVAEEALRNFNPQNDYTQYLLTNIYMIPQVRERIGQPISRIAAVEAIVLATLGEIPKEIQDFGALGRLPLGDAGYQVFAHSTKHGPTLYAQPHNIFGSLSDIKPTATHFVSELPDWTRHADET